MLLPNGGPLPSGWLTDSLPGAQLLAMNVIRNNDVGWLLQGLELSRSYPNRPPSNDWLTTMSRLIRKERTQTNSLHVVLGTCDTTDPLHAATGSADCPLAVAVKSINAAQLHCAAGDIDQMDAERLYQRRWAMTVLDNALRRLEAELTEAGRQTVFARLQGLLVGDRGETTYTDAARDLHTTEAAVKMTVSRLRQRARELIRNEIAQTVCTAAEVDEEFRALFDALQS